MADQDLLHTAEIMKAALPYIDPGNRVMADFLVKTFDLMGSWSSMKDPGNVTACGFSISKIDIEGLLNAIRPLLNNKEREFIDRILGFFNMKKMFEMYNNMMEAMKTMQGFGDFSFGDSDGGTDANNVTDNFSKSNYESIFESFMNASAMNNSSSSTSNDMNSDSDINSKSDMNSNTKFKPKEENETYKSPPPPGKKSSGSSDRMFEMLKAMVPPEQMSTFENISMLLNTMSYDNNSKTDDSKECCDG